MVDQTLHLWPYGPVQDEVPAGPLPRLVEGAAVAVPVDASAEDP